MNNKQKTENKQEERAKKTSFATPDKAGAGITHHTTDGSPSQTATKPSQTATAKRSQKPHGTGTSSKRTESARKKQKTTASGAGHHGQGSELETLNSNRDEDGCTLARSDSTCQDIKRGEKLHREGEIYLVGFPTKTPSKNELTRGPFVRPFFFFM